MSIPQAGGGRGPVQYRNMSDPSRGFMLPPPSPNKNMRGEAGSHESPTENSRSFRRPEGLRMGDLYANLPASTKVIPDIFLCLTECNYLHNSSKLKTAKMLILPELHLIAVCIDCGYNDVPC
jgi:hypothetical protein